MNPLSPRAPTLVREVQEGQGGQGEEGRLGPQKLRLQKQVGKFATGQAADPGSPKGSQEAPVPALTSAVPWKDVLFLCSLLWLSVPEGPLPSPCVPPSRWAGNMS